LYAHVSTPEKTIHQSENELHFSIQKTYDLYHLLFDLLVQVRRYAEDRIEARKHKNLPTQDDLNPNTRFIKNRLITKISDDKGLNRYIDKHKLSWINHPELVKNIYQTMLESESYSDYINSKYDDFQNDRKLCEDFYMNIVLNSEMFMNELEEQSIYWNDDLDFVVSMVLKTLRKFKPEPNNEEHLLELYKDEEDREFTSKLFRKAVLGYKENRKTIEAYTKNWDVDRVAVMDILIMELALTELIEFPSIPVKVSLNEYIELAKYYSTQRSGTFINGVLDRIARDFREEGKIVKAGRGLLEG
jgi:N utilization substance protein B